MAPMTLVGADGLGPGESGGTPRTPSPTQPAFPTTSVAGQPTTTVAGSGTGSSTTLLGGQGSTTVVQGGSTLPGGGTTTPGQTDGSSTTVGGGSSTTVDNGTPTTVEDDESDTSTSVGGVTTTAATRDDASNSSGASALWALGGLVALLIAGGVAVAFFKKRQVVTRLAVEPEVLEALYPSMRNQLTPSTPAADVAATGGDVGADAIGDAASDIDAASGIDASDAGAVAAALVGGTAVAAANAAQPAPEPPTSIDDLVNDVEDTVELSRTSSLSGDRPVEREIVLEGDPYPGSPSSSTDIDFADSAGWSNDELAALAAVADESSPISGDSSFFQELDLDNVSSDLDSIASPPPQWSAPSIVAPAGGFAAVAAVPIAQAATQPRVPTTRRDVMRTQIERTRQAAQDALSEAHKLRMEAARLGSQADWQVTRNQGARTEAARRLGDLRPGANRAISETSRSRGESARLAARAQWCTERAGESRKLAHRLLGDADRMQRELDALGS